jgi:iron-sulfur cluster assembly protein
VSALLTVTQTAAETLDNIVASAQHQVPEAAGVRIVPGDVAPDGSTTFGLLLAESPEPSDQVVETGQAPVFVDPDAADLLDDKVLDAQVMGDRVAFVLGTQS